MRDESLEDIERTDKYLTEALKPSIEVLQDAWEEILDTTKRHSRVAWALLRNAAAKNLIEDVLTVEFPSTGEAKGFLVSGHDKVLTDAMLDVVGVRLRIAAVVRSDASPSTRPVGDTGRELTGMELIQRQLGGQVIGEPSGGYSDEPPF